MGSDTLIDEGHTAKSFDQALGALRLDVLAMGGLVIAQVRDACDALLERDLAAAELVLSREPDVNAYDSRIDEESHRIIALHQPVAGDLRLVRSLTRAAIDLERVGDEAKKIARAALAPETVGRVPLAPAQGPLREMAQQCTSMLRSAVLALDSADAALADQVRSSDTELDAQFEEGLRRILALVIEYPAQLRSVVSTVLILKALERVGDHAKNVAEHVVFFARGIDVRHETSTTRLQP